jgi:subtilisin-like proprotein convertase family protein
MGLRKSAALLASAALALGVTALAVPAADAAVFNLSNNTVLTISPTTGAVTPTNITNITQFGMSTTITDVNVTIQGMAHTFPDDLDIELIGPDGTAIALISDACGGTDTTGNFTFDDASATALPDAGPCPAGTWKPTDAPGADTWHTTPTITTLAGFNGKSPNGTWRLYVSDEFPGADGGSISGWSLQITTAASAPITVPALGSSGSGPASPYPVPIAVTGLSGNVTDVNLKLNGVSHTWPDDLDMVLVSPTGVSAVVMSDVCGSIDLLNATFTIDDEAAAAMPVSGPCPSGAFKPSNNGGADPFPAPAPAAPYGATLSVFDGSAPNGTWNLFVNDDTGTDGGWIGALPTLEIKTSDVIPPETTFTKKPKTGFKRSALIKFTASEAGSHFECKVDTAKKFKPCTSPLKLKKLKYGKHKIQIRAIDAAGNVDPTPLRAKWKVIKKK